MNPTEVAPRVAILVMNYDGKKWLEPCFNSLVRTSYQNIRLYLVDNASSDGSVEFVQQEFPKVKVIRHDKNYGFAEGYNRAVEMIDADYILFLNNDTRIVNPNWVGDMVNIMEKDDHIAAIACKMLSMGNPKLIDSVGGGCYWWTRGFPIGFGEEDYGQYDNPPIEPFSICGGATLIRRNAFVEVGGFDTTMFAFYEDLDLCWRLRLRGYRIAYVPSAVVLHYFSGYWGPKIAAKAYFGSRNFLRSMLKNYSIKSLMKGLPTYFLFTTVFRILGYLLLFRMPFAAWATLKGALWNAANLADTLRQRRRVQNTRVVSDRDIIRAMGHRSREPVLPMLMHASKLMRLYRHKEEQHTTTKTASQQ